MLRKIYFKEKPLPQRIGELLQSGQVSYTLAEIAELTGSTVQVIEPIMDKFLDAGVIEKEGSAENAKISISQKGKTVVK